MPSLARGVNDPRDSRAKVLGVRVYCCSCCVRQSNMHVVLMTIRQSAFLLVS